MRIAIDCLPRATRVAMLQGIRENKIIVGAYSDSRGICPMLAAHRAGGRTSFIAFARAWDRFALGGRNADSPRRATERELLVLRSHLEASLLEDEGPAADLKKAMREHEQLAARRRAEGPRADAQAQASSADPRAGNAGRPLTDRHTIRERPGDPSRFRDLRRLPGWSWMRVTRRYDDYQNALAQLERTAVGREGVSEPAA